ncbi:hypothetical protein KFE25_002678 [Diacronema lutheri]|uniref:Uncharacterized protein n=2 Tax=Diacronema lutheri TaxID=2081491 RepID=A0A8J5XB62_DIALT|nr:hypothetical protein KFE25_002678 [Diacronema lutheri]
MVIAACSVALLAWSSGGRMAARGAPAVARDVRMQRLPWVDRDALLANSAFDPYPFYEPEEDFKGTMRPGTRPENAPYEEVMARAHLCDNKNVVEWSLDDRAPIVREPDVQFLEWIKENGLLYDETVGGDQFSPMGEAAVVLEDEFEFEDGIGELGFDDADGL